MNTIIKYITNLGTEITEEKAHTIGNFRKDIIINNALKISEGYRNNLLTDISYLMDSNETLADLISQFSSYSQEITFIRHIDTQNSYKVYEQLTYQNGNLIRKLIRIDDTNDDPILTQLIDTISNLPIKTEKYHLDSQGNTIYEFEYDSTGNLKCVTDWRERDGPIPASMLSNPDVFNWTGLDFYRKAEPIIPGT